MSPLRTRRGILQTLAVGAGASFARPLLPWSPSRAHAARTGGFPARFLFIYVPNGIVENSTWEAEFGQATPGDPANFKLGAITAPLEPFRKDVVLLDNMELKNAQGDTHISGMLHLSTGRQGGGNISPHEYLGQQVGRKVTPQLPIIRSSIQTKGDTINYGAGGVPIAPNQDPYDVYKRVFANVTGVSANPDARDQLLARVARRKSVLDYVAKDLTTFRKQLPLEDIPRADAQLDAIRSLEQQLAALANGGSGATCKAPGAPMTGLNHQDDAVADQLVKMQLGNIVAAFACDLSRVASFQFRSREFHYYGCRFPQVQSAEWWHSLSHDNYPMFRQARTAFNQWVIDAVATRLKAIPEGGGTMLDNTLVFVGTEIGRGHTNAGLQFFTIGGRNLGVKTGQYIKFGTSRSRGGGESVTNLYVSILQAMGLPDTTFGDASTGPISSFISV